MNPFDKKPLPTSPQEWLAHAYSDLKLAKLGEESQEVLAQQICFHAQQAVEKALKGVLLFHKVDFPLTHDIEQLIDILGKAAISLPSDFLNAGSLTPYAVETRYPGYWGEIARDDVVQAIELAEKIIKWVEEHIGQ
jgi:HEPN domain-containing protein